MYMHICTAPLSPCKGRLRSFRDDDDDDDVNNGDSLPILCIKICGY